jgi:hypothetical protein
VATGLDVPWVELPPLQPARSAANSAGMTKLCFRFIVSPLKGKGD